MLTLVEQCPTEAIVDRPNLGCAMLISACQEKGIRTTLIKGQTRYLRDMFISDTEELWHLVQDLKSGSGKKMTSGFRAALEDKGIDSFKNELKELYQQVIINKNLRYYLDYRLMKKFNDFYTISLWIYNYYVNTLKYTKLNIIRRCVKEILKSNPRYIGFSLQYLDSYSINIMKQIKKITEIPIIVGGPFTPFMDPKTIKETLCKGYFDYLVVGSAEHALPSLIKALENKNEPRGIFNVLYAKNGEIETAGLKSIDNLDSLPYPDFSQFDLDLYFAPERILPLQTTRGCSWRKCTFCNYHRIYFGLYRTFGIKRIIETISYLKDRYDCCHFMFHDEDLPPIRAEKISKAIIANRLNNLFIYTYARFDKGFNNNRLLALMHSAGFKWMFWGFESGCQRVLNLMNKGAIVSDVSEILKKMSQNKIYNMCMGFFGFPGETREEAQETIEFLKRHSEYIDLIRIQMFHLLDCSAIKADPIKWGIKVNDDGSYSVMSGMSPREVCLLYEKFTENIETGKIKVTSNEFRQILTPVSTNYYQEPMGARISDLGLLANKTIMRNIKRKLLAGIFPVILGEIKKKGKKTIFYPSNINDNVWKNNSYHKQRVCLNNLCEDIFNLSDGKLSIKYISSYIGNKYKNKKNVHKMCVTFFQKIFSKNWGIGFAKPYPLRINKKFLGS